MAHRLKITAVKKIPTKSMYVLMIEIIKRKNFTSSVMRDPPSAGAHCRLDVSAKSPCSGPSWLRHSRKLLHHHVRQIALSCIIRKGHQLEHRALHVVQASLCSQSKADPFLSMPVLCTCSQGHTPSGELPPLQWAPMQEGNLKCGFLGFLQIKRV